MCLTPNCVKASADFLKNIDPSVDPCDDFYAYSCGGWLENNLIPEEKTKYTSFSVLSDKNDRELHKLLIARKGKTKAATINGKPASPAASEDDPSQSSSDTEVAWQYESYASDTIDLDEKELELGSSHAKRMFQQQQQRMGTSGIAGI